MRLFLGFCLALLFFSTTKALGASSGFQIVCSNPGLKQQLEQQLRKARVSAADSLSFIQQYLHKNNFFFSQVLQKSSSPRQAKGTPDVITYTVRHPYRYRIFVHGAHLLSRKFDKLKLFRLSSSALQLSDAVREAQQQIYSYYVENAYLQVQVSHKLQQGPRLFEKQIHFYVQEGGQIKINQLSVYGNISRPASYYEALILKKASKKIKNKIFVRKDLNAACKKVHNDLIQKGHLRAKVQATRTEYISRNKVKVYVFVSEGPLTLVQNLSFEGNQSFSSNQLADLISVRPQQALKIDSIMQSLDKIKYFYRSRGFIDVQIDENNLIQYTQQLSAADVQFKITEGPQVQVRQIRIEGLSLTKAFVVRNEINLKEGDIVSHEKINNITLSLNQLALFSLVDVQIENSSEALRDIVIRLQERKPGVFRLGLGVTDRSGYSLRGYVGVLYKNLAGTGRSISSRFTAQQELSQVKYLEKYLILSYWEPFLLSPWFEKLRGRLNLTYDEQVICFEDSLLCPGALRGEKSVATTLFVEKNLGPHFRLKWKLWSLDWLQNFQRGAKIKGLSTQPQKIALMGLGVDMDYTDNILNPRRGLSANWNLDYSTPWAGSSKGVHFVRVEGALHHHLPLQSLVWAHALRSGYVQNLSSVDESQVPLKHAFFLGGSQTVRGFSGLGSHRIPSSAQMPGVTQWQLSKSSWYALFKSELRFPIVGKLAGVIFYDAGGVWVTGYKMHHPLRQSYGVGLRLHTPVGPLSLDYARKLHQLKFANNTLEPAYYVHFSLGTF